MVHDLPDDSANATMPTGRVSRILWNAALATADKEMAQRYRTWAKMIVCSRQKVLSEMGAYLRSICSRLQVQGRNFEAGYLHEQVACLDDSIDGAADRAIANITAAQLCKLREAASQRLLKLDAKEGSFFREIAFGFASANVDVKRRAFWLLTSHLKVVVQNELHSVFCTQKLQDDTAMLLSCRARLAELERQYELSEQYLWSLLPEDLWRVCEKKGLLGRLTVLTDEEKIYLGEKAIEGLWGAETLVRFH